MSDMSPSAIKKALEAKASWFASKTKITEEGGEFLPLTVWAARGWCAETIRLEAAPEDKRKNKLGMDVYRVQVEKTANQTTTGRKAAVELATGARRRPLKRVRSDEPSQGAPPTPGPKALPEPAALAAPERSPRGKSSSSSSSSEDSGEDRAAAPAAPSPPREPSPKTAKRMKKEQEKAEKDAAKASARQEKTALAATKAEAKAAAKAAQALATKAGKVHALLQRSITSMKDACKSEDILLVPDVVANPVRGFLGAFQDHLRYAKEIRDGQRTVWISTLDDLPLKEAAAATKRLQACVHSLAKVPR